MKFLVALLALSGAAIAAPAVADGELKFYKNVEACGCVNAQGDRKIGDQCNYYGQWRTGVEAEYANLCFPTTDWAINTPMSTFITDDLCSRLYFGGGSYPKAECKTVRLCTFKSTYQLCDTTELYKPPLGNGK